MKLSKFKKNKTKFREISVKTKPQPNEKETKTMRTQIKRVLQEKKCFIEIK